MIENLNTRIVLVIAFLAFTILWNLPNVVTLPAGWPFKKEKLNYGLDIQGGSHLVYGVDVEAVLEEKTARLAASLDREFQEQKLLGAKATVAADKKSLEIAYTAGEKGNVLKRLNDSYGTVLQVLDSSDTKATVKYFDTVLITYKEQVIGQAIEVIRNRVDEFGVAEPVISAQGTDRVVVQLPGVKDASQAKELINKTAKLVFRIVSREMEPTRIAALVKEAETAGKYILGGSGKNVKPESETGIKNLTYSQYFKRLNEDLKSKLPPNTLVGFEKAPSALTLDAGKIAYLLTTDKVVSGDLLEDAHVGFGEYGEPVVNFRFGPEGARLFGTLTESHLREQLAIVLDDVVFSAPSINSRIDSSGQITLGRGNPEEVNKEATLIATALRAGALPASLQQMEERTVGPSLGSDSVAKGRNAGLIGVGLVLMFMIIYYKGFGAIAGFTLVVNVMSLLAILNALGATITLPGIAGIALTVGMAVDANVIIFERIKEEMRRGVSAAAAVKDGFNMAFSAIFDSNVTTAIAGVILIYFGSGPVRGFGVTMVAGIVTTMITAVFVTHTMLDTMIVKFKFKNLPI